MISRALVLILVYFISFPAYADDIGNILDSCSRNASHVEMTDCLQRAEAQYADQLRTAESTFLAHLEQRLEGQKDIALQRKFYEQGKIAFETYRKKQCEFYVAMTAGANGAHDVRLACTAALNSERVVQLQWAAQNWK